MLRPFLDKTNSRILSVIEESNTKAILFRSVFFHRYALESKAFRTPRHAGDRRRDRKRNSGNIPSKLPMTSHSCCSRCLFAKTYQDPAFLKVRYLRLWCRRVTFSCRRRRVASFVHGTIRSCPIGALATLPLFRLDATSLWPIDYSATSGWTAVQPLRIVFVSRAVLFCCFVEMRPPHRVRVHRLCGSWTLRIQSRC